MALQFVDGFDLYNTADIPAKWNIGNLNATVQTSIIRSGGQALKLVGSGTNTPAYVAVQGTSSTRFILSTSFYLGTGTTFAKSIASVCDGTPGHFVGVGLNGSGSLCWFNGNTASIGFANVSASSWHTIGADITLDTGGAGTITLYLDGTQVAASTGLTSPMATASIISLGGDGSGIYGEAQIGTQYYDDFIVMDGTGSYNNSYTAGLAVVTLLPSANGRVNQWSVTGVANNYQAVNSVPPSGDTAYVYDDTVGDEDTYALGALSGAASVLGVQVSAFSRKDNTSTRTLVLGVGNGTTEAYGTKVFTLSSSYTYGLQEFDINPLTSATWQVSDFSTLQAAQKVNS